MRQADIEALKHLAADCFQRCGWALPPHPKWDITDFGLGDWRQFGLVLINLAEEPEYCEKLMYAQAGMTTPAHCHRQKKEDIICRSGRLKVTLWPGRPDESEGEWVAKLNGEPVSGAAGRALVLEAGERITLFPGIYHEFVPLDAECVIGEVSTANDDLHDNFFADANVGRFPEVETA